MKIKITCTKKEKEQLNEDKGALKENICSILPECPKGVGAGCDKCLSLVVEWEVTDDGCGKG